MSGSAVLIVTGLAEDFSISGGEGSGNPFATAFMSTCGIFGERDSGGRTYRIRGKAGFPGAITTCSGSISSKSGNSGESLQVAQYPVFQRLPLHPEQDGRPPSELFFFRQRLSVLLDSGGFVHMNAQVKPAQNDKPQVMHQHGGKESPCRHSCQMARRGQNKTAAPAAVFAEFSVVVLIRTHGIISKKERNNS